MRELVGIALKRIKKEPMELQNRILVTLQGGLVGDIRGKRTVTNRGRRQVTIISHEQWQEACAEIGVELPWETRRANLCVSGQTFGPKDVGKLLRIGRDVILLITGETEPCKRMDDIHNGLRAALAKNWRGGVTCEVVSSGEIKLRDDVTD